MLCVGCGANIPAGTRFCPSCGADQTPVSSARVAPGRVATAATGIDLRRLPVTDLVSGISSIVVFVSLFLPWYGFTIDLPAGADTHTYSALSSIAGGFRFLILVLSVLTVGYLLAKSMWRSEPRLPLPEWQILGGLTGLQLLLVVIAFLASPAGFSTGEAGAGLGLIAAVVAAVGAGQARMTSVTPVAVPAPAAPPGPAGSTVEGELVEPHAVAAPGPRSVSEVGDTVPTPRQLVVPRRCPDCGVALVEGNHFCTACGKAV